MTTQMAAYFLEKRRPSAVFGTKHPAPNIVIDYPFLNGPEKPSPPPIRFWSNKRTLEHLRRK